MTSVEPQNGGGSVIDLIRLDAEKRIRAEDRVILFPQSIPSLSDRRRALESRGRAAVLGPQP